MTPPTSDFRLQTSDLEAKGARFNPLELTLPETLPLEDWAAIGRQLTRSDQVLKWWLGDWAAFGLRKYGQLKEFAEANNLSYQTLRNLAWVSQSVELSRRRDNVDWTKHAEIAALKPREQTKWLDQIVEKELPVAELRRQIRQSQSTENALAPDGPAVKFISKACDDLHHWLKNQPAKFWTPERKAAWRARLQPIVEFYDSLA
jgi:hypothetical protein